MLVDTHAHLQLPMFDQDRKEVIERAKKAGVGKIIIPGIDLASSKKAVEIAEKEAGVWTAVGIHPGWVRQISDKEIKEHLEQLAELVAAEKVVAIGEIGLDKFKLNQDVLGKQKRLFEAQVKLASEADLPVIIHNFGMGRQIESVLESYPKVKGVFHCFSGGVNFMRRVLAMGFYISFTGNLTYSHGVSRLVKKMKPPRPCKGVVPWHSYARDSADAERSSLRRIATPDCVGSCGSPLGIAKDAHLDAVVMTWERLLLETDSPFMTPRLRKKEKKERNEPKNIKIISEEVARLLGKTEAEIEAITTKNASDLFGV